MKKDTENKIMKVVAAAGKKSIKLGYGWDSWLGMYQPSKPQGIEKFCKDNKK